VATTRQLFLPDRQSLHVRAQRTKAGVTPFTQWVVSCSSSVSLSSIFVKAPKCLMGRGRDAEVVHKAVRYNGKSSSLTLDMDAEEQYCPSSGDGDSEKTQTHQH
jgi:hypothetical protein